MTGEIDDPADREPSMDPRDPRGETDPITDLTDSLGTTLAGGGELGADKRAALTQVFLSALRPEVERKELGHIAGGRTSEDAAELVGEELERRSAVLEAMTAQYEGDGPIPGERGQQRPPTDMPPAGPGPAEGPTPNAEGQ